MRHCLLFCLSLCITSLQSQVVNISIDPTKEVKPISPYIYGRNNNLPKESYASPLTTAQWTLLKESGLQFLREGGGNNATKYNWRKGLSSHPDWYNNVYGQNWDIPVKMLNDNMPPSVTGMWTLPLIGKAASNNTNNFNDWGYNNSQWWSGTGQNLAGGGTVNRNGGNQATVNGNPNLYLQDWNADSVVGILDHWRNTLGIPNNRITYWNMDNEPEIWHGTHDDVVNANLSAETFMQNYFAVAKKARAKFPAIKLVGPVTANEWQWYNWMNRTSTTINGRYYPWLEFFIKRCAEEQAASGVRLLDVLDIHFYPSESTPEQIGQLHRVFFDQNYNYPGANGLKSINGGWDNNLSKEYIFVRINEWLTQYFGQNHGIKLGLTEIDVNNNTPSVVAVWYASMMGEFMKNDVALFSPWSWKVGMWETLHLFARYNQSNSVQGISSDETLVSAYPSVNDAKNNLTVVLVNRSTTVSKTINLNINNFTVQTPSVQSLRLADLPANETFVSHSQNVLQQNTIPFSNNTATINLPPLSITSLTVSGRILTGINDKATKDLTLAPNPTTGFVDIKNVESISRFDVYDVNGRLMRQFSTDSHLQFDISDLPKGYYSAIIESNGVVYHKKIIKM